MPELTRAILHRALSEAGFLRPVQFRALGYDGPFQGWKRNIVGRHYSQKQIDDFVALKKENRKVRSDMDKLKLAKAKFKKEQKRKVNKKKNKTNSANRPLPKKNESTRTANRNYNHELRDERWIKKRNSILVRDGYKCISCNRSKYDGVKLNVHHLLYDNDIEIWEVPDWYLVTLCDGCHKVEHSKRLSQPRKHF